MKQSLLRLIAGLLLVGIVTATGYWWYSSRTKISTDDAYVVADSVIISSRITGTVVRSDVENDAFVSEGKVLLELDPQDYQVLVDKARAALERTQAEIQMAEVMIDLTESQTSAQVQAAEAAVLAAQGKEREARHRSHEVEQLRTGVEAEFSHARRDLERYTNLFDKGAGSEQQRDRTSTLFKKAKAQCDAADAQVGTARAALAVALQEIDRAKAQLQTTQADRLRVEVEKHKLASLKAKRSEQQAELRTAELNLSYCTIKAPASGYAAQSRIEAGERIQSGQPLLSIVPLQEAYVEANFKETQLEDVRLGQPVEIKADIYRGYTYHGRVVGIRAGTGAAFSLLPPENATGNWIKVVQRIPVKIKLDTPPPSEYPLRVGASLEVTMSTTDKSGLRLPKQQPAQSG
jgi:membrane fusion protein (multidrug efflux system)